MKRRTYRLMLRRRLRQAVLPAMVLAAAAWLVSPALAQSDGGFSGSCFAIDHNPANPLEGAPSKGTSYAGFDPRYAGGKYLVLIDGASGLTTGEGSIDNQGLASADFPIYETGVHGLVAASLSVGNDGIRIDPSIYDNDGIFEVTEQEVSCDTDSLISGGGSPPPESTTTEPPAEVDPPDTTAPDTGGDPGSDEGATDTTEPADDGDGSSADDTVPEDTTPEDTTPEDTAPEDTTPDDTSTTTTTEDTTLGAAVSTTTTTTPASQDASTPPGNDTGSEGSSSSDGDTTSDEFLLAQAGEAADGGTNWGWWALLGLVLAAVGGGLWWILADRDPYREEWDAYLQANAAAESAATAATEAHGKVAEAKQGLATSVDDLAIRYATREAQQADLARATAAGAGPEQVAALEAALRATNEGIDTAEGLQHDWRGYVSTTEVQAREADAAAAAAASAAAAALAAYQERAEQGARGAGAVPAAAPHQVPAVAAAPVTAGVSAGDAAAAEWPAPPPLPAGQDDDPWASQPAPPTDHTVEPAALLGAGAVTAAPSGGAEVPTDEAAPPVAEWSWWDTDDGEDAAEAAPPAPAVPSSPGAGGGFGIVPAGAVAAGAAVAAVRAKTDEQAEPVAEGAGATATAEETGAGGAAAVKAASEMAEETATADETQAPEAVAEPQAPEAVAEPQAAGVTAAAGEAGQADETEETGEAEVDQFQLPPPGDEPTTSPAPSGSALGIVPAGMVAAADTTEHEPDEAPPLEESGPDEPAGRHEVRSIADLGFAEGTGESPTDVADEPAAPPAGTEAMAQPSLLDVPPPTETTSATPLPPPPLPQGDEFAEGVQATDEVTDGESAWLQGPATEPTPDVEIPAFLQAPPLPEDEGATASDQAAPWPPPDPATEPTPDVEIPAFLQAPPLPEDEGATASDQAAPWPPPDPATEPTPDVEIPAFLQAPPLPEDEGATASDQAAPWPPPDPATEPTGDAGPSRAAEASEDADWLQPTTTGDDPEIPEFVETQPGFADIEEPRLSTAEAAVAADLGSVTEQPPQADMPGPVPVDAEDLFPGLFGDAPTAPMADEVGYESDPVDLLAGGDSGYSDAAAAVAATSAQLAAPPPDPDRTCEEGATTEDILDQREFIVGDATAHLEMRMEPPTPDFERWWQTARSGGTYPAGVLNDTTLANTVRNQLRDLDASLQISHQFSIRIPRLKHTMARVQHYVCQDGRWMKTTREGREVAVTDHPPIVVSSASIGTKLTSHDVYRLIRQAQNDWGQLVRTEAQMRDFCE